MTDNTYALLRTRSGRWLCCGCGLLHDEKPVKCLACSAALAEPKEAYVPPKDFVKCSTCGQHNHPGAPECGACHTSFMSPSARASTGSPRCATCGSLILTKDAWCWKCKTAAFGALSEGRKDDAGKDPWHLMPFDALRAVAKVLRTGADKYGSRNWEEGMAWSRLFGACLRHLIAWHEGEKQDPETGYSHLWLAACNVLFLVAYEIRGIGHDDRPMRTRREVKP